MSHRSIRNKHNLYYESGILTQDQVTTAMNEFITTMKRQFRSRYDNAQFEMAHVRKYGGGYIWVSNVELYHVLLGLDMTGFPRKLPQPTETTPLSHPLSQPCWADFDTPTVQNPSVESIVPPECGVLKVDLTLDQTLNLMDISFEQKADELTKKLHAYTELADACVQRQGSADTEAAFEVALNEEGMYDDKIERIEHRLSVLKFFYEQDRRNVETNTLDQSNRLVNPDLVIPVQYECIIKVEPSHVRSKTQDVTIVYSREAPGWITQTMVWEKFNRLLENPREVYTMNNNQVFSPLVRRHCLPFKNKVLFRVHFLGKHPSKDASFALQIRTFTTFENGNETATVLFDPDTACDVKSGPKLWRKWAQK